MPVDSNGNYSLPPGYLAVPGQTILATQHNPPLEDIAAALSQVVYRSGVAPFVGNQSMGGFRMTNAAAGSDDGDYVTMAQLNAVIATISSLIPTGARGSFFMTSAPSGWIVGNGGTIGSAASGATNRANADTQSLFNLFWAQFNDATLPIQTSGGAASTRGASAAADWAANKRLTVFDLRTRYDRGADLGLGFDPSLTVGLSQADDVKPHNHTGTTDNDGVHSHPGVTIGAAVAPSNTGVEEGGPAPNYQLLNIVNTGSHQHNFTTNNAGTLETRPRSVASLPCIKL